MDERQRKFVDREKYRDDAVYHSMVDLLGDMISRFEHAMEHEGVDRQTIGRVINIVILGHPYGFEAQLRIDQSAEMVKLLERMPVGSGVLSQFFGKGAQEGRSPST